MANVCTIGCIHVCDIFQPPSDTYLCCQAFFGLPVNGPLYPVRPLLLHHWDANELLFGGIITDAQHTTQARTQVLADLHNHREPQQTLCVVLLRKEKTTILKLNL